MKKRKRNKTEGNSISSIFAKKYIYFYYAFFWIVLIIFLLVK